MVNANCHDYHLLSGLVFCRIFCIMPPEQPATETEHSIKIATNDALLEESRIRYHEIKNRLSELFKNTGAIRSHQSEVYALRTELNQIEAQIGIED